MEKTQFKNRYNRRLIIFLAGMILAGPSLTQTWISSNAVWHYNFEALGGVKGYHKITYLQDTVVMGEQCQYLQVIQQMYSPSGPPNWNYIPHEPDTLEPRFTFLRNDTVFYYNEDRFSILYCMDAVAGQSWDLGVDTNELLCSRSIVNVESTGTINLNGQSWPTLNISPSPDASVWLYGRVVGRFGAFDRYLFPLPQCCDPGMAIEFPVFYFSCFEDDEFPLIQMYEDDCDNPLAVGIAEPDQTKEKMIIYPNPASDKVHFRIPKYMNDDGNQIIINDLSGKEKCRIRIDAEVTTLDISDFPRGMFLILLTENDCPVEYARLIKY
ncbi:MAG: T9SS type A sorting domain-containing protein [Bacteroidales bacterium]|jgi:hypothetical protein|nr:T9SS type A sorting domain-containing protein [Bacteroidales bacterium]